MEECVRGFLAFVEVVAAFPFRSVFSHMPMIVSRNSEPVEEERKMLNRVRDDQERSGGR